MSKKWTWHRIAMVCLAVISLMLVIFTLRDGSLLQRRERLEPIDWDPLVAQKPRRSSFDVLLHRILHPEAACASLVALGGKRYPNGKVDGDKIICSNPGRRPRRPCIAYSFGVGNEWSFDEAVHKRFGCEVFSFDPSMNKGDHLHSEGVHFYNMGIGESNTMMQVKKQLWQMRTLDSIMAQLGHANRTIDILKMDIEGNEFAVLEYLVAKGLLKFVNHLCVEIHLTNNPHWQAVNRLLEGIRKAGLRHFSSRNNSIVPPLRVVGFRNRFEQHLFEIAWYKA